MGLPWSLAVLLPSEECVNNQRSLVLLRLSL
jgi:hypothetical protein